MSIPELRAELLRTEYPFLRADHDPDIERYYELRNLGRSVAALTLYQTKLKRRLIPTMNIEPGFFGRIANGIPSMEYSSLRRTIIWGTDSWNEPSER